MPTFSLLKPDAILLCVLCLFCRRLNLATASSEYVTVRLADGTTRYEGRVEYSWYGIWGTICDTYWDYQAATVVCRQLGYGGVESYYSGAHFGEGLGFIWGNIHCHGDETDVSNCARDSFSHYSCPHSRDAGVRCYPSSAGHSGSVGGLRLAGGPAYKGRVEIYREEGWFSLCNDRWDIFDTEVACKHLGYPGAYTSSGSSEFGRGSGPLRLTGVECDGTESTITSCRNGGWSEYNCPSDRNVAVECRLPDDYSSRLTNGPSRAEGYVEVWVNPQWVKVCSGSAANAEAEVICTELGFDGVQEYFSSSLYGNGAGLGSNYNFHCSGGEQRLSQCSKTSREGITTYCYTVSVRCKEVQKLSPIVVCGIIAIGIVACLSAVGGAACWASKCKKRGDMAGGERTHRPPSIGYKRQQAAAAAPELRRRYGKLYYREL